MNKYEAMFIVRADLSEDDRKGLFNQINDAIQKNSGQLSASSVWAERRKFYFVIKKQREGLYYLVNFSANPLTLKDMQHAFGLNENILRVLISNVG